MASSSRHFLCRGMGILRCRLASGGGAFSGGVKGGAAPLPLPRGGGFSTRLETRHMCASAPNITDGGDIWGVIDKAWYFGVNVSLLALIWYFNNLGNQKAAEIRDLELARMQYDGYLRYLEFRARYP